MSADTRSYVMVAFGECDTGLLVWVCPISLFYSWSQLTIVASRVAVCTHIIEPVFRPRNIDKALIFQLNKSFTLSIAVRVSGWSFQHMTRTLFLLKRSIRTP